MTDLPGTDLVVLYDGKICTPAGDVCALVETRGLSRTRRGLREVHRWAAFRRRGLSHLAHRLTVRVPGGEVLFHVEKPHDRVFRRVLMSVYGADGLPLGRLERIRRMPLAGGCRLVGSDGAVLGTLKRGIAVKAVGLDAAGRRVARIRYGYHDRRMVGEVSFAEAPEPYRILVLGYAAVIYLSG